MPFCQYPVPSSHPGILSRLAAAPVAMMTASARTCSGGGGEGAAGQGQKRMVVETCPHRAVDKHG
jgi:hypothetical protein